MSLRRARRRLPAALTEPVDAALDPDPAARPPLGELLRRLEELT